MSPTVLIVEDEPNMLQLLGMALERGGYEIQAAQKAEIALQKIHQEPPDLVILDIMLPEASGLDLLKALRSDPKTANLPVMILSALSGVDEKVAGLRAGADEYVTKPVEAKEIVARVEALLERTKRLREAGPKAKGQVVTFLGVKGGVGTTTLVLNLAGALVRSEVSVVALELQAAYSSFAHQMGLSHFEHLGGLLELDPGQWTPAAVERQLTRHASGLQMLCTFPQPAEGQALEPEHAESLLNTLTQSMEYVFVDLSTHAVELEKSVLGMSNTNYLVMEPTPICLDAARARRQNLRQWAWSGSKSGCIIVNRSGIASSVSATKISSELDLPVLGTVPQAGDVLAGAYERGQLLLDVQPDHIASEAIKNLAKALVRV